LPDSALTIVVGVLVGAYLDAQDAAAVRFDGEIFFHYLLPWIILQGLPLTSHDAMCISNVWVDTIFLDITLTARFTLLDGYFTDVRAFLANLDVILLLALLGTVLNTVAIAAVVHAMAGVCGVDEFRFIDGLVFGSLIAAVDPVAVLAVFNEIHVNDNLYITVLGESTLNDGIAIVLFRYVSIPFALSYHPSHTLYHGIMFD
jgi:NhaP-type Na+/H+ or K+/H+ antiporter